LRLRDPIEGALVTWNPKGRPARKEFFEPERPIEATKINAARIKVCNKVKKPHDQLGNIIIRRQLCTWYKPAIIQIILG
jgi:hypothetical protein